MAANLYSQREPFPVVKQEFLAALSKDGLVDTSQLQDLAILLKVIIT